MFYFGVNIVLAPCLRGWRAYIPRCQLAPRSSRAFRKRKMKHAKWLGVISAYDIGKKNIFWQLTDTLSTIHGWSKTRWSKFAVATNKMSSRQMKRFNARTQPAQKKSRHYPSLTTYIPSHTHTYIHSHTHLSPSPYPKTYISYAEFFMHHREVQRRCVCARTLAETVMAMTT